MSKFTSNRLSLRAVLMGAAFASLPAAAFAVPVNGINLAPRVGNGNPSSTLTMTTNNTIPGGTVSIDDRGFTQAGTNRHDALISGDNGATAGVYGLGNGFTIQGTFNLTDGFNSGGRKEAGFEINGNPTGRALFIINSDAGEIVAFGGGMPFKLFGNNAGGNGYTPGQAITLGMTYTPGTGGAKGTLEYFIDRTPNDPATGFDTSGPLNISNVEGGPTNYTLGAYAQVNTNATNFPTDFIHLDITNLSAVVTPEPTTLAALSLGGLLLRRRR